MTHPQEVCECAVMCRKPSKKRLTRSVLPDKLPVLHAPIEPKEPGAANAGEAFGECVAAEDSEIGIGDAAGEIRQPVGEPHPLDAGAGDDADAGGGVPGLWKNQETG